MEDYNNNKSLHFIYKKIMCYFYNIGGNVMTVATVTETKKGRRKNNVGTKDIVPNELEGE